MKTSALRRPLAPLAIAAALLAAFLLLFAPLPASAHDDLLESSPAAGSTVETLPSELTLTFSANLIDGDGSTEVVVTDAAGTSVTDGPATVNGSQVVQPLVAEADAGDYRVIWKVVSSDGHATSKEFSFSVATSTLPAPTSPEASEEPSAEPTTETSAEPSVAPTTAETDAPADDSGSAAPWIIVGVLVVAAIAATVLLRTSRARRRAAASGSNPSDAATGEPSER